MKMLSTENVALREENDNLMTIREEKNDSQGKFKKGVVKLFLTWEGQGLEKFQTEKRLVQREADQTYQLQVQHSPHQDKIKLLKLMNSANQR